MKTVIESTPETGAGNGKSPAVQLLDKRALGTLLQLSTRSISNQMERGMPHLKIGQRRVRFEPEQVLTWLRSTYSCQRLGKLNGAKP